MYSQQIDIFSIKVERKPLSEESWSVCSLRPSPTLSPCLFSSQEGIRSVSGAVISGPPLILGPEEIRRSSSRECQDRTKGSRSCKKQVFLA
ncbi:unnamed protein product [Arctogadus glacialis]